MEYHNNEARPERALLVSVDTGEFDAAASLEELYELTESAGAQPVGSVTQKRESPDGATCVGAGRLEEIRAFCEREEVDLLIFDCELTPTQIRNLETEVPARVIDRTMLILDIFAQRAKSREGKLQVELAQLQYMLPRLQGRGTALSRLGGGIGTRGPGESKLESDRRHIRRRIAMLKEQLEEVERRRGTLRRRRKKDGVVTVAIVGYTNAGKSTLLNALTRAGVLAEDRLFATLDPTSRALKLPNGVTVMLVDTVGLVRRLPHHLVEAFKSTLEEAAQADILLNVCDASSEEAELHLRVTRSLLEELGCMGKPIIPVLNKCDLVPALSHLPMVGGAVRISARTGEGLEELLHAVERNLPVRIQRVQLLLPFGEAALAHAVRQDGTLLQEEFLDTGVRVTALVDERLYARVRPFLVKEETPLGE
jgi:GTP-binding protein HflX